MRIVRAVLFMVWGALPLRAEEALRLSVPTALEQSGFAQFLVPRFALKAGIRIERVAEGAEAQMAFVASDAPSFEGLGQGWALEHNGDPRAIDFATWLRSDIGRRTIESFTASDGSRFVAVTQRPEAQVALSYDGNRVEGERLSLALCGRCHVINETNRMNGMGSTPSFSVLRSMADWDDRFATFHLRNPHPSFTQIAEITDPFDPTLPPPMVPLEMTQGDLDAILAYVSGLSPADLGAPLQVQ
ncbi:MAG: cytochrome c [Pseudomonadota bacterium]